MNRCLRPSVVLVWPVLACSTPAPPPPVVAAAPAAVEAAAPIEQPAPRPLASQPIEHAAGEGRHLANIRQLTATGRNGDARFDLSGQRLLYQSLRLPVPTERLVEIAVDGGGERLIEWADSPATGVVETHRGLVYSSRVEASEGVGWRLHEIRDGQSQPLKLDPRVVQDARDAAYAPASRELFFSARAPDRRALFVLGLADGQLSRLTDGPVDDSSPAPTADGQRVAFRRQIAPGRAEIYLLERRHNRISPLTGLGADSGAPTMHPGGQLVLFASNYHGERDADLLLVRLDDLGVERVTYRAGFDGLPSCDGSGRKLAWTSSRQGGVPQVFVADWLD